MLFRRVLTAVLAATTALVIASCTDDEKKTEEVVKPSSEVSEPAAPAAFSAEAVYFAFDDYTLNSEAQGKLSSFAEYLKTNKSAAVQVEGHCDERGSIEYNLALGERRAQAVKSYLAKLGVESARLSTISYGEEKPKADGHDESAWGQNRRAEFVMSGQ